MKPRCLLSFALALASMGHPAAAASGLGTAGEPAIPWLRIGLSLAFCVALAAGAILALRRHQGRLDFSRLSHAPRRRIEVIETRRISPHGDVCLMHCEGHAYLIAVGQGHALVLDKQPVSPMEKAP
ncbi:hypothetical protein MB02_14270 [Croceicoccus estronivorus]|uniref:flagellar biosynthetic protein FliO n=1 Tax=Croceicoccus estronivorus TaxID=1172626 RepID=UPI00082BBF0A|nr:flagellar biosynthetic protein FliO [Croceicoccus estronivorus]OCC22928.1 hypothetical protein MB02_14270 [Croceicoccus estronivorus]